MRCTRFSLTAICTGFAATAALAVPPVIDGTRDASYPAALAVQDTQTQFGNTTTGLIGRASGGSELDNIHAYVEDCKLYIHIGGNLESNNNDLEIFFDTRSGGQNQLRNDNPNVDGNGLNRMGGPGGGPGMNRGLVFEPGFDADFWLTVQNTTDGATTADNVILRLHYAELRDGANTGVGYYVGEGRAADELAGPYVGGGLSGGTNPYDIRATINNSNILGVDGGTGFLLDTTPPAAVTTGIEICIPLEALGLPSGDFDFVVWVNGGSHDFLSNQVLPGLFGGGNLGEPRNVDFGTAGSLAPQLMTVTNATPCGSCCDTIEGTCTTTTEAGCAGDWTVGESCFPNPCVADPPGACCLPDFSCTFVSSADCATAGGTFQGAGELCIEGLCALGACCDGETCTVLSPITCAANGGEYQGDGSTCVVNPCAFAACCLPGFYCVTERSARCAEIGGTYQGDAVECVSNPCEAPADQPVIDGTADASYGDELCTQIHASQFGDSNLGVSDAANGSEIDGLRAIVTGGRVYLHLSGNLESNFNKLDIFIDSRAGGQNRLRGDNPNVDFNGLNRMGETTPDVSGDGLTFDSDFEADYYLTLTCGGSPTTIFANYAELGNPGVGRYLGSTLTTSNGTLIGGSNPDVVLVTLNNSNIAGVPGGAGTGLEDGSGVLTGVEISLPLAAIGNPTGDIKVSAFINGQGHDFLSNQVMSPLDATEGTVNLGEPRLVNFTTLLSTQYCTITQGPARLRGDSNCDGAVNFDDIDCFIAALIGLETWEACGTACAGLDEYTQVNDTNADTAVNFDDIDAFITCLISGC